MGLFRLGQCLHGQIGTCFRSDRSLWPSSSCTSLFCTRRSLLPRIPRSLRTGSRDRKEHTKSAFATFTIAAGTDFTKTAGSTKDSMNSRRAFSSME